MCPCASEIRLSARKPVTLPSMTMEPMNVDQMDQGTVIQAGSTAATGTGAGTARYAEKSTGLPLASETTTDRSRRLYGNHIDLIHSPRRRANRG